MIKPTNTMPRERTPLPLPNDLDLPFFAYGSFKPGELAFSQISEFLDQSPHEAEVQGALYIRDGLPLLVDVEGVTTPGYLLNFKEDHRREAYEKIGFFEPPPIYKWSVKVLEHSAISANVLIGKSSHRGGAENLEGKIWSFRRDPVFEFGLTVVQRAVDSDCSEKFENAPPDSFGWDRFFRLQMAYLLLWSAIERFSAFAGAVLEPSERVKYLGNDYRFAEALKVVALDLDSTVFDSRDPATKYRLDPARPDKSAQYYYY